MVLTRKNIEQLSWAEMDKFVLAMHRIQQLPPDHPDSYFVIAGYHGEPFRGAGYGNASWWGGYCNHGNILFPTWHRAYLLRLEKALQNQVPGVTLPYWNEIDDTTKQSGIPSIYLAETYTFQDQKVIPNPLRSYRYQKTIKDRLSVPYPDEEQYNTDYSKPAGKTTCRFPFSGLWGPNDSITTEAHNKKMEENGIVWTNEQLNRNVKAWLNDITYETSQGNRLGADLRKKFEKCLEAPNYTVFSNTTSAQRWNDDHADMVGFLPAVSLESPHNGMHLAIGGIQVPAQDASAIPDANGDMAENDTASFDPIFYLHHAFIDLMFWRWQIINEQTNELRIESEFVHYPGTNSVDAQGPTPGVPGNKWLTLDDTLDPFGLKSKDVINIETQLGYTYDMPPHWRTPGHIMPVKPIPEPTPTPQISVAGVNRSRITGSFAISAWAQKRDDEDAPPQLLGVEPVLSRWHVAGCGNCQAHLQAGAHVPLEGWSKEDVDNVEIYALVHTRANPLGKLWDSRKLRITLPGEYEW